MMHLHRAGIVSAVILLSCACHPGAINNIDPKPSVGGTIAGLVRTGGMPVVGRKVTASDVASGAVFTATTGTNGGYTIKVPEGTYRIDVELHPGETIATRPDQTKVNNSDLDSGRDFNLATGAAQR